MANIKIGLLPLYIKLYDDSAPDARKRVDPFLKKISNKFTEKGIEVVEVPVCRIEPEFEAAINKFENENVDAIVTLHMAYSPSLESEKALARTKLPIVVLDTTENYNFVDTEVAETMYNHGIHGVQDMCNLLIRNNKKFYLEVGHYEKSDVMDRMVSHLRGIKAAQAMKNQRVGRFIDSFKGMGDFLVSPKDLKSDLGVEVIAYDKKLFKKYENMITDAEIEAEIAFDKANFIDDGLSDEIHREVTKAGLIIRKWIDDQKLTALTVNFFNATKESGIPKMPFTECCKAMSRGIGYAGEGDTLTASLVGSLMSVYDEATFVEMFCPDWEKDIIFLSHMGEVNINLLSEKPILSLKPFPYADTGDTAFLRGTYKPGKAVFVNLAPMGNGKYSLIISDIEVLNIKASNGLEEGECGFFSVGYSISDFLKKFSLAGGTHHSAMVYGDVKRDIITFGEELGFKVVDISK